jgi:hypothetical protein
MINKGLLLKPISTTYWRMFLVVRNTIVKPFSKLGHDSFSFDMNRIPHDYTVYTNIFVEKDDV